MDDKSTIIRKILICLHLTYSILAVDSFSLINIYVPHPPLIQGEGCNAILQFSVSINITTNYENKYIWSV